MKRVLVLLCSAILLFATFGLGNAASIAVGFNDSSPETFVLDSNNSFFQPYGYSFSPKDDIKIVALGAWDENLDGFEEFDHNPDPNIGEFSDEITVWIYDDAGNQLMKATVDSQDSADGSFRYTTSLELVSASSFKLEKDQSYYIMAMTGRAPMAYDVENLLVDALINYGVPTTLSGTGPGAAFIPLDQYGLTSGIFGPNFQFQEVPVPPALLLLGSGFLGLIGLRKRANKN